MKKNYSTIEAVFHNSLIKHMKSLDFKVNDTACTLQYIPQSPKFKSLISLSIELLGHKVFVDFSQLAFLSLHTDTKDIKNYTSLPKELQQALAQFIFENLLTKFSKMLNTPISFLTNLADESMDYAKKDLYPFVFNFSINNEKDAKQIPVLFYLSQSCIEQILPLLNQLPTDNIEFKQAKIPCTIEVGSMELSVQELRDLEEGDVLLVDSLSHLTEDKSALFYPLGMTSYNQLPAFLCTLEKNTLIFSQTYRLTQETSMSEEIIDQDQTQENTLENQIPENQDQATILPEAESTPVANSAPANFGDIKLKVSFELERRTMTIAELEALCVGSNMLLDSNPQQPVTLVVSDTAFAKARIVEIDGKYGLQLTEILVNKD